MKITLDVVYIVIMLGWAFLATFILLKERGDLKRWAPEAKHIETARKKRKPLAIVVESSRMLDIFVPTLKDGLYHLVSGKHNYGTVFDPEADSGLMYHSGSLKVFFSIKDHAEVITPEQAMAINSLLSLKPESVEESRWWEIIRMTKEELKENMALLNIKEEAEIEQIERWKNQVIKKERIHNGPFAFDPALEVLNPAHSSGHLQNLQSAWFKKGSFGNIDQTKLMFYGVLGFIFFMGTLGIALAYQMIK
jgi:hypothetical protein